MKITFVIQWANMSGGIRVVTIYAERLKQRGHKVVVLSSLLRAKVPLRRVVKSLLLGRGWLKVRPEPSYLHSSGVEYRVLSPLRPPGDTDVPDADVVVATFWRTAQFVQQLSPAKGAKAILIQGYEVQDGQSDLSLDATWRLPMHKIVISKWLRELAREKFGDSLVSHVPNSVDLDQFNAVPRRKQEVPTVGLLFANSWFKGCRTSLGALKKVATSLPSVRLVCFGAEQPGRGLRPPHYADFYYQPAQDQLKQLYAQCDVWLCGSNREGFHLPPLEAMACRCPVVSTRVGGPMDIIEEGVNGHLVNVGDEGTLADRVSRVLGLPQEDWTRMSEAAYRTAASYSWDDATDLFEKALELAIERRRRRELLGSHKGVI